MTREPNGCRCLDETTAPCPIHKERELTADEQRIADLEAENQRLRNKLACGTFPSECATCKRLRALCGEAALAIKGDASWIDLPDRLSAAAKGE